VDLGDLQDQTLLDQTSPLNVRRIGGVTMAENHSSTRPPITRKAHRCQADVDLVARFICHANSTRVLQSLWRGLATDADRCWTGAALNFREPSLQHHLDRT
jgi:hypothetical protein